MGERHQDDDRRRIGVWVVATLGAAAGAAGGWLWARTRRDRLVARAGSAVHAEEDGTKPHGEGSGSAVTEPERE